MLRQSNVTIVVKTTTNFRAAGVNRPWTPELRAEREALSLTLWLRDQGKAPAEWLDALAADQTLTEPVRQRALQFARDWK